jgi:acetyltransferase-like isoleucine patch superfamily enzyme
VTAWRALVNRLRRWVWRLLFFRVLFGERSQGALRPATRLSPTVCIEHEAGLALDDEVFIGHFCFIEASAGVRIGRGTQITNFVSIVSHSTHRSVRVAAALSSQPALLDGKRRVGDVRAGVEIGAYGFIGPHSTIEAGARLGQACLVQAHSQVRGEFPAFSVIGGQPARVQGDVRERDRRWLAGHPEWLPAYEVWAARVAAMTNDRGC